MRERLRQQESLTPSEKVGWDGGDVDDECSPPGQHLAQGHHPGDPQADEAGREEWAEVFPVPEADGRGSADPTVQPAGQAGQGEDRGPAEADQADQAVRGNLDTKIENNFLGMETLV